MIEIDFFHSVYPNFLSVTNNPSCLLDKTNIGQDTLGGPLSYHHIQKNDHADPNPSENYKHGISTKSPQPMKGDVILDYFAVTQGIFHVSHYSETLLQKISTINIPHEMVGNQIQKKIWNELKKIKVGNTITYGKIAKKYKLSPRHVGKICGQNNLLLVVPCHRVIRTDGSLGGFTSVGGIKLKKKLLEFEKT